MTKEDFTKTSENHYFVSNFTKPKPPHTLVISEIRPAKLCFRSGSYGTEADPDPDQTCHLESFTHVGKSGKLVAVFWKMINFMEKSTEGLALQFGRNL